MAFFPAHCDNNCKGCEKNSCGWCVWLDRATKFYKTKAFNANRQSDVISVMYGIRPMEWRPITNEANSANDIALNSATKIDSDLED